MSLSRPRNIVFFGTPPFAATCLEALIKAKEQIVLAVTQPDRRAGRGQKMVMPAVKKLALSAGIPVLAPTKLKDKTFLVQLDDLNPDLFVVVAYGRILPEQVFEKVLTINVHASLLPRWRGAAPIARAIMAGDTQTGVSIMKIVQELDAGDVLVKSTLEIRSDETTEDLTTRLAQLGARTLVDSLALLKEARTPFVPQDPASVTYAKPLHPDEGHLNWTDTAVTIHNRVRGLNPWPGAFIRDGKQRIKIYKTRIGPEDMEMRAPGCLRVEKEKLFVRAQDRYVEILEIQREGRARQPVSKFLPGYRFNGINNWA